MKCFLLMLIPLFISANTFHTEEESKQNSLAVVKVFTHALTPNHTKPWNAGVDSSGTGSGVIVNGNMILTAAHVVTDATYIEVQKHEDPKKFFAHVKWIAHDADLALLEIEDKTFFEGTVAKKLGATPKRQEGVAVYGYPLGGNKISITQGIISRIEFTRYAHSYVELLTIQIDAAINPGNSGGPGFNNKGEIVGIAIQGLTGSNNIGYIAPVNVIQHFFDDIKDGTYDGFPVDGTIMQPMENKDLKEYYNMGQRTGVLIRKVYKHSSSDGYIKDEDIILGIDGINVADDNTVEVDGLGRVSANYLIAQHFVGDVLHVKILRDNKELIVDMPLKATVGILMYGYDHTQRYYIFSGFVFMPYNSKNFAYLRYLPDDFYYKLEESSIADNENKEKEIVFIRLILEDKINSGYSVSNAIVKTINEEEVDSLDDLAQKIKDSKNKVKIVTAEGVYILDKDKAMKEEANILKRYGVKEPSCMTR